MTDLDSFVTAGGVPAAKFPSIGTVVRGVVLAQEVSQVRDFETQQPATWPDGNPKMQLVVTVQTDERDPDIDGDDGRRRVFAPKPSGMLTAIADALTKSGTKPSQMAGGTLAVKFESEKPHEKRGYNAIKQYRAQFQPGAASAADDLLGGGTAAPVEDHSDLI